MTVENYDRRKLIILRFVLIAVGAGMGYLALWQYFLYYPDVIRREFQIVISVVSSALVALILGLSAKPFYRLGASIVYGLRSVASGLGMRGIVALVLGLVVAGGLVTAFDFGIRLVLDIWAVRLLADVLVYIICAAGCCYGFTKWLNTPKSEKRATPPTVGYLVSADCFTDDRCVTAVYSLMNVKVSDGAYKALCLFGGELGADAVRRLDALIACGRVTVVRSGKEFADRREYDDIERNLASSKRLRLVRAGNSADGEVSLELFSPPTAELMAKVMPERAGTGEAAEAYRKGFGFLSAYNN